MPLIRGKWIHHSNCTWCYYTKAVPLQIKKDKVARTKDVCQLHGHDIPAPQSLSSHGLTYPFQEKRYCEDYIQLGCGCEHCRSVIIINQLEEKVDI